MSSSKPWQCLSVQDFLGQVNWDGNAFKPNLHQLGGATLRQQWRNEISAWGTLTVQNFFQAQNWIGQPLEHELFSGAADQFVPLFTAKVGDFFRYLPWEGQPAIARLPEIKPSSAGLKLNDDLTLTDLSDLF